MDNLSILQGLSTSLMQGSIYLVRGLPRYHRDSLKKLTLQVFAKPLRNLCVVAKNLKKLPRARLLYDHVHPEDRVLNVILVEDHRGVHPRLVFLLN
jgi:hypothetical protein